MCPKNAKGNAYYLIKSCFQKNIEKIVNGNLSIASLKELLSNYPVLLYQTGIKAREFFAGRL